MRISDCSSDVCSSDRLLLSDHALDQERLAFDERAAARPAAVGKTADATEQAAVIRTTASALPADEAAQERICARRRSQARGQQQNEHNEPRPSRGRPHLRCVHGDPPPDPLPPPAGRTPAATPRSEEHTSELQSLMRTSY